MKKQILTAALLSLLTAGLTAAELTVAATPVPHGDILRLVAPDLKAQGYDLKVVEFSDFVSPNIALDAKEVTANYYQHKPFLDDAVKSRGLKIASVAPIHILPMAAYSKRIKSLNDLPKGARISIPNDPANGGRALLLLQSAGVIKLKAPQQRPWTLPTIPSVCALPKWKPHRYRARSTMLTLRSSTPTMRWASA